MTDHLIEKTKKYRCRSASIRCSFWNHFSLQRERTWMKVSFLYTKLKTTKMFWIKCLKICYERGFKNIKSASNSKKSYNGILTENFDHILCWFYYKICFIFQNKTNHEAWSALYIKFIQLIFSFLQFATKWSKKTEFKRKFVKLVKILWFWTF